MTDDQVVCWKRLGWKSRAPLTLRSADLLKSRTMPLSGDNDSDLTRANTRVPGKQSRTATTRPRTCQVVLGLDETALVLNLRKSFFVSGMPQV